MLNNSECVYPSGRVEILKRVIDFAPSRLHYPRKPALLSGPSGIHMVLIIDDISEIGQSLFLFV